VIAAWKRGAEGERQTAKALRPLEKKGWHVRHDLADRGRGNLDHVVVGMGGVFLLDSKNVAGSVIVEDGLPHVRFPKSPVNDYTLPNLVASIRGAARGVRERLHTKLGSIVDVYPVVVISGTFDQRIVPGRVRFVRVDALAAWLEQQPRRISDTDLVAVARAVDDLPLAPEIPWSPTGAWLYVSFHPARRCGSCSCRLRRGSGCTPRSCR